MDLPILYEDVYLLVINKPSGVVVNRAQSVRSETVQDFADVYLHLSPRLASVKEKTAESIEKDIKEVFSDRSGVAHRIDKETSGCLLIAKTPEVLGLLLTKFRERDMKKVYLAIVHGKIEPQEGEIKAPVGRLPWNPERFGIVSDGKESVTRYKVIRVFERPSAKRKHQKALDQYCLVECYPETGRTHQIRVHLKYINHPIVGDYLYAGRKTARDDREWAPRVMLHAWKLVFDHPITGQGLEIVSPVPDDMMKIVT